MAMDNAQLILGGFGTLSQGLTSAPVMKAAERAAPLSPMQQAIGRYLQEVKLGRMEPKEAALRAKLEVQGVRLPEMQMGPQQEGLTAPEMQPQPAPQPMPGPWAGGYGSGAPAPAQGPSQPVGPPPTSAPPQPQRGAPMMSQPVSGPGGGGMPSPQNRGDLDDLFAASQLMSKGGMSMEERLILELTKNQGRQNVANTYTSSRERVAGESRALKEKLAGTAMGQKYDKMEQDYEIAMAKLTVAQSISSRKNATASDIALLNSLVTDASVFERTIAQLLGSKGNWLMEDPDLLNDVRQRAQLLQGKREEIQRMQGQLGSKYTPQRGEGKPAATGSSSTTVTTKKNLGASGATGERKGYKRSENKTYVLDMNGSVLRVEDGDTRGR